MSLGITTLLNPLRTDDCCNKVYDAFTSSIIQRNISTRFSIKSKANASEFLENPRRKLLDHEHIAV